jgi:hypothetical protein
MRYNPGARFAGTVSDNDGYCINRTTDHTGARAGRTEKTQPRLNRHQTLTGFSVQEGGLIVSGLK